MLDPIALLQSLTLPAGATTGTRIVLNGNAGTITGFDANNDITFLLGGGAGRSLRFSTGDNNELTMAIVEAISDQPGNPLGRLILSLFGPEFTAGQHAQIGIASPTLNGTTAPTEIDYLADLHQFANHLFAGGCEVRINGFPQEYRNGAVNGTTDVNGDLVITHGLGRTPVSIAITPETPAGAAAWGMTRITAKGATTFTLRAISIAGNVLGSTAITGTWTALRG